MGQIEYYRAAFALRLRDMARRGDEHRELPIGHFVPVDPESLDRHVMRRAFFGIAAVAADPGFAASDPCLAVCRFGAMPRSGGAGILFIAAAPQRQ